MVVPGKPVKLQPQDVRRDLGCAFDIDAGQQPERIGHVRRLRCPREVCFRPRKCGAGSADGRDPDRRGIGFPEQSDVGGRRRNDPTVARHHLDRVERIPVALDAGVGPRPAVGIFEGKIGQTPARALAQVERRREPALQGKLFRRRRRAGRGGCGRDRRRVGHI